VDGAVVAGGWTAGFKKPGTLPAGADSPGADLASVPHQPLEPRSSRLHQIQPPGTGLTCRVLAMCRVLGTGAPKKLHIAQIHHAIPARAHCRSLRSYRSFPLPSATSPGTRPASSPARRPGRTQGGHRPAPQIARHPPDPPTPPAPSAAARPAASAKPPAPHRTAQPGKHGLARQHPTTNPATETKLTRTPRRWSGGTGPAAADDNDPPGLIHLDCSP
jgi:hypothetical protein